VTLGTPAARAAKAATATIPIVFTIEGDPVTRRLVTSWARPGGNVTGLAGSPGELYEKRWQLLKEAVPGASRLAYLWDANYGSVSATTWVSEFAMPRFRLLGLQVQFLEVKGAGDFMVAFERATSGRAEMLFIDITPMTDRHFRELAGLASKSRLPAIASAGTFADAGLLMSYGVNLAALAERRAAFVGKILKGAKPADLPVEQPTKFEFVINLKTAKTLGLTIPPAVLARADEVIACPEKAGASSGC
jgi:putative ABC transport system substrate-binding protein